MSDMHPLRILAVLPDAFGSLGGMSKFYRDLLTAICLHPLCGEVLAVPRLTQTAPGPLPDKITWLSEAAGGKWHFLNAILRSSLGRAPSGPPSLRLCHH